MLQLIQLRQFGRQRLLAHLFDAAADQEHVRAVFAWCGGELIPAHVLQPPALEVAQAQPRQAIENFDRYVLLSGGQRLLVGEALELTRADSKAVKQLSGM